MEVEVAPEPLDSADALRLLGALNACLSACYPPEGNFFEFSQDDIVGNAGIFLVARSRGEAVGCGAIRRLGSDTAELKRLFVVPAARGRGVARKLLATLETWAVAAGLTKLVLETGPLQTDAIRLYRRSGFVPIPCFNEYVGCEHSICFGKPVGSALAERWDRGRR